MKYTDDTIEALQDRLTQKIKKQDCIGHIKVCVVILVGIIYIAILHHSLPI